MRKTIGDTVIILHPIPFTNLKKGDILTINKIDDDSFVVIASNNYAYLLHDREEGFYYEMYGRVTGVVGYSQAGTYQLGTAGANNSTPTPVWQLKQNPVRNTTIRFKVGDSIEFNNCIPPSNTKEKYKILSIKELGDDQELYLEGNICTFASKVQLYTPAIVKPNYADICNELWDKYILD